MPKVYGFCGDNKCKREVVPVSDIAEITKDIGPDAEFTLMYPNGFTKDNSRIIAITITPPTYTNSNGETIVPASYPLGAGPDIGLTIACDQYGIRVQHTEIKKYNLKLLLMKTGD